MSIPKKSIEDFKNITNKDLVPYLEDVTRFFQEDYSKIVDFYRGRIKNLSSTPLTNYKNLVLETKTILELFSAHARVMKNYSYWELLEVIEEIDNRLLTVSKIAKWTRSSKINTGYSQDIKYQTALSQKQTFEQVSRDLIGSNNPEDEWSNIVLENNLIEEDYTTDGGVIFDVKLPSATTTTVVESVVDIIEGKSIYGKDLHKKLTIDEVEEDLLVLDYDDTILQSIDVLIKMKKNDNPDSPSSGLQSDLIVGTNRASLNFPAIIRQLQDTFSTDDTIQELRINSIKTEQDNTFVDYEAITRLGETKSNSSPLI